MKLRKILRRRAISDPAVDGKRNERDSDGRGPLNVELELRLASAMAKANADRLFAYFSTSPKVVSPELYRVMGWSVQRGRLEADPQGYNEQAVAELTVKIAWQLTQAGLVTLMGACESLGDGDVLPMSPDERTILTAAAAGVRDLGEAGPPGVRLLKERLVHRMIDSVGPGWDWSKGQEIVGFATLTSAAEGLANVPTGASIGLAVYLQDLYGIGPTGN